MKKIISLLVLAIALYSCSEEPDSYGNGNSGQTESSGGIVDGTSGYAPNDVVGKEFRFYKIEDGEFKLRFNVIPAQIPSNSKISFNSQYVLVSTPYFCLKITVLGAKKVKKCVYH